MLTLYLRSSCFTQVAACLLFEGFFSKPSLKSRNTIFTLGQRGAILSPAELEGPILVPHTAQRGDSRVGLVSAVCWGRARSPGLPGSRLLTTSLLSSAPVPAVPVRDAVPQSALRSAGQRLQRVPLPVRLLHGGGKLGPGPLQQHHGENAQHVSGTRTWLHTFSQIHTQERLLSWKPDLFTLPLETAALQLNGLTG